MKVPFHYTTSTITARRDEDRQFILVRSMQYFLAIRRDTEETPYTRTFACVKIKVTHSVREFAN